MAQDKIHPKAKPIDLTSHSKWEFFLIHGYTGSPTDFKNLPEYIAKKFNVNVKIPLLQGHGTKVEDLDNIKFEDFLNQVEAELKKEIKKGKKIILGGYSFGAQLALLLAAKFRVKGVILVSIPYKLKFPFNIRGLKHLMNFKRYWRKRIGKIEWRLRQDAFDYKYMHGNGLFIIKKANKVIKRVLKNVTCPCLNIHSKREPIGNYQSVELINKKITSKYKKSLILHNENHNPFFSEHKNEIFNEIADFYNNITKNKKGAGVASRNSRESVTAIVPAYNEGERIADVLNALIKTKMLKKIVVVDDGSIDNTEKITRGFAKRYSKIKYLKNEKNMGKAYSMERGVQATNSEIIFFCDADLSGLTPKIVQEIIEPVLNNEVDMFIGVRNNIMQKIYMPFAIKSGERALRRDLWEKLPKYYKHRYRIETGLNYFVKRYGKGLGYKIFPHYQTLKEKKYGFFKGTFLRWWMNFDVVMATIRANTIDLFRKFDEK